jgi:hypothetical protein
MLILIYSLGRIGMTIEGIKDDLNLDVSHEQFILGRSNYPLL